MELPKPVLAQISTLKDLPTLPHILLRLIEACNQAKANFTEISQIIEKDPSLSSRILRLVNSAYYGLPRKIKKMEDAVALLGTTAIKNVAISASISEAFKIKGNGFFNLKRYWGHSLKTAILAKRFSEKLNYDAPDEAFLAGLMHDIGRLVLWVNFKEQYKRLLELYGTRPDLLLAGEIRLGATHCEVGAWLLHKWNLPSFMVDAVLYHHDPVDRIRDSLPLVQIIYAANALCQESAEARQCSEGLARDLLGLPDSLIQNLVSQADEELIEVARSLDIDIEPPSKPSETPSEKDAEKQRQLVREVQDTSSLIGTLMNLLEAPDEASTLREIYHGLQILFDLQEIFVFLYEEDRQGLVGADLGENERWKMVSGLYIPSRIKKSLLIRSLDDRTLVDSFSPPRECKSVILDEQLIRFIGKEGILCLPLYSHNEKVGVIILGLDRVEFTHLSQHFGALQMFARHAAMALYAHRMKKAQLKALQTERLGASYEMARKVIHEINNPLSIIKNYLKILALKLAEKNIAQDEIRIINEEIDRVSQILQGLLSFSDVAGLDPEPVDINAIVLDLVRLTKEPLFSEHGISIHTDLDPSLPPVLGNKNGLKQVFLNLVHNAAEALNKGGNIFLKTRKISAQLGKSPMPRAGQTMGFAEITVSDDGPGIPDEVRSKIFQPFVSTKGGPHSGLGLSVAYNIIKALRGTLTCESEKGKGTTFRISLPLYTNQTT